MKKALAPILALAFAAVWSLMPQHPAPTAPPTAAPKPAPAAAPTPGVPAAPDQPVDLDPSFMIPQDGSSSISHTPAVVFADSGKRMLTATSADEIVVFETASRKLLKRIKLPEAGSGAVSIDGAGRFAVWVQKSGGTAVMDLESEKVVARDPKLDARWLAASPDGTSVAVARGKELELRELPSLKLLRPLPGHEGEVTNVGFSPDGARVGSTAQDGRFLIHDAADGAVRHSVKKEQPLYAFSFHPRGTAVAYGGQDNQVYQYTFETRTEEVLSKNQPYWITSLGYSPDGGLIAVGDESCDIWLYEVETKNLTFHNKHHVECWLNGVAWAPDNETFLFGCRPNSHAGKPQIWGSNTLVEANKSDAACASRTELLTALDREVAQCPDEKRRGELIRYKQSLQGEDRLAGVGQSLGWGYTSGLNAVPQSQFSLADSTVDAWPPTPAPVDLPKELKELADKHTQVVQQQVTQLQGLYCVNQWRIKRK